MPKETIDYWTMIGSVVTAGGTVVLVLVTIVAVVGAWMALGDWHKTLANQRADECTGAARDVRNFVNRCIDLKLKNQSHSAVWKAYDEAWSSWRHFDRNYAILLRYDAKLDQTTPDLLAGELLSLEALCNSTMTTSLNQAADSIKSSIAEKVNTIEKVIKMEKG